MAQYEHIQDLAPFFGIDLRTGDRERRRGFASDGTQDVNLTAQGALTQRYGTKWIGNGFGKYGLYKFQQVDITGTTKTEIIGFGADTSANSVYPYRLKRDSFTLTNSHASQAATVTMEPTATGFVFTITRGGSTLYTVNLGTGLGGSTTLSTLRTAVNALTSFSMSAPTTGTTPASFMESINAQTIAASSGTLTVYYWYWEQLTYGQTGTPDFPLINYAYELGLDSFHNVSAVVHKNCLYFTAGAHTGKTLNGTAPNTRFALLKYDGQSFYEAGVIRARGNGSVTRHAAPYSGTDVYGSRTVAGGIASGSYYKLQHVFVDKAGNRFEGALSEASAISSGAAGIFEVPWQFEITRNTYNQRFAQVNGAQVGKTSAVSVTGCTLQVGDIAFFYDSRQGRWIQREVTAATSTSLSISTTSLDNDSNSRNYDDGAAPNWEDDSVISANLRMAIWRTKQTGTDYYFLDEVAYVADNGYPQTYFDNHSDSALQEAYVEPLYSHSWLNPDTGVGAVNTTTPGGRYVATYNDQLIVFGDDQNPNTVYFSDTDGHEYFPRPTHSFDLAVPVTGAHQSDTQLMLFGEERAYGLSGDLLNFNFRIDRIGDDLGCISHHSIQALGEGTVFFLSKRGPCFLTAGRALRPLGAIKTREGDEVCRIEPYFTQRYAETATQPVLKRALSALLPQDRFYVLFVPHEDPAKPGFATSASTIWVFDYGRGAWWKWTGLNFAGGMCEVSGLLYGTSRFHDGAAGVTFSNASSLTSIQLRDKGRLNYADHITAQTWRWKGHWETLGDGGRFKRFLRARLHRNETGDETLSPTASFDLDTYVNWDTSSQSNDDTLTWSSGQRILAKLKAEKCQAMQVVVGASTLLPGQTIISGIELEAVADFKPILKE